MYTGKVWIAPYLKSEWHKWAAMVLYFAVLGAHLLESYWASVTFSRTMGKLFRLSLEHVRSGTWPIALVNIWTTVFWFLLGTGAMFVGVVMFVIQISAIADLYIFTC